MEHSSTTTDPLPLAGIKVLDFSRLFPGAYSGYLLSCLGAKVLKVEDVQRGDYIRNVGLRTESGAGALHEMLNRGKRSVAIDIFSSQGRDLILDMSTDIDVVLESFRPGVMASLGLAYEDFVAKNANVVYASLTGFGQNSPHSQVAGHDINYMAESGWLYRICSCDHGGPSSPAAPLGDLLGGLHVGLGIQGLLHRVASGGVGGYLDVSIVDTLTLTPDHLFADFLARQSGASRPGMVVDANLACYGIYEAADCFVAVGALESKFFGNLCAILGLDHLAEYQFTRGMQETIRSELSSALSTVTAADVRRALRPRDTCVSVVATDKDVSEWSRDNGHLRRVAGHPLPVLRSPFVIDGDEDFVTGEPAPSHGQDTRTVLGEFGVGGDRLQSLASEGIIGI